MPLSRRGSNDKWLRGLSLTKSNGESLLHVPYIVIICTPNHIHYNIYRYVGNIACIIHRLRFDVHLIAIYICLDIAAFFSCSIIWSGVQSQSITFANSKSVFNSFVPSLIAFLSLQIYVGKPHSLPPPALSFAFVQVFFFCGCSMGLGYLQFKSDFFKEEGFKDMMNLCMFCICL